MKGAKLLILMSILLLLSASITYAGTLSDIFGSVTGHAITFLKLGAKITPPAPEDKDSDPPETTTTTAAKGTTTTTAAKGTTTTTAAKGTTTTTAAKGTTTTTAAKETTAGPAYDMVVGTEIPIDDGAITITSVTDNYANARVHRDIPISEDAIIRIGTMEYRVKIGAGKVLLFEVGEIPETPETTTPEETTTTTAAKGTTTTTAAKGTTTTAPKDTWLSKLLG
ncbi:MAG: hypothetical protein ABIB71_01920 [Candidatus Woesearchaeota archaeon]